MVWGGVSGVGRSEWCGEGVSGVGRGEWCGEE